MQKIITVPPPNEFSSYSPSQLFKFFFQLGHWTEEGFSSDFQAYTRGTLISSVTINKWKNRDVIPTRYAAPLLKLIEAAVDPKIATNWTQAFEIVWATHLARAETDKNQHHLGFNNPVSSNIICQQHGEWIKALYNEALFGEKFSTRDLYIPLQLVETQGDEIVLYDNKDLLKLLKTTEKSNWIYISGASGSGKSMLALHLAQELTGLDTLPIYLRGKNLSDIEIEIQETNRPVIDSFSASSFLRHFRASSRDTACLILDGIDEILRAEEDINKFLSELRLQQNICEAQGKNLTIALFARNADSYLAHDKKSITVSVHLEILGLDGGHRTQNLKDNRILGEDMRSKWWAKYLSATGQKIDINLPEFLCTDYADFLEFGTNPLGASLICQTAIETRTDNSMFPHEIINSFTYSENTNLVYRALTDYISRTIPEYIGPQTKISGTPSLLQTLALAHWQKRQIGAFLTDAIDKNEVRPNFSTGPRNLNSNEKPYLDGFLGPSFFPPQASTKLEQKRVLQFPHDNLVYYIVATLIVDCFIDLIKAKNNDDRYINALKNWALISGRGVHDPVLADFCQKEARLRFEEISDVNWDTALTSTKRHLDISQYKANGLSAVTNILNSASLLLFVWSCFNLERHRNLGTRHEFSKDSAEFDTSTLRQIHPNSSFRYDNTSLDKPKLKQEGFLTPSLSAVHLIAEDLSQLSFPQGHMESAIFETTSFAMTHWSHVKISASSFKKSTFQQALFHGCRWHDSEFSDSFFQGTVIDTTTFLNCRISRVFFSQCHFTDVDFLSSVFEGVIFDRCVFESCGFESKVEKIRIAGVEFRYCTFLSMETPLHIFSQENLVNCIIRSSSDAKDDLSDNFLSE